MKVAGIIKGLAVSMAVLGFCLPQPLLAAATAEPAPVVIDVKLHRSPDGNVLIGQVQDPQGLIKADAPVFLVEAGRKVAETRTDQNGYFGFKDMRGGVYQVAAAGGIGMYRAWAPGTAPPSAQHGALVVAGENLVRGQCHFGRLKFWLSHPCVIAAIIAAAVAIPVAIHNADDGEAPTSP